MGLLRRGWLVAALVLGRAAGVPAQAAPATEYQLKAVFLFNFAQFVEWPPSAFPEPAAPLVIGVLGEDPFGAFLEETVRGESVNGHPLAVEHFRRVEDITACHILFIGAADPGRVRAILDSLRGRSILTVSDGDGFAARGGMIGFVTDRDRIRLLINLAAAQAADLTISSKLLRPSQIVSNAGD